MYKNYFKNGNEIFATDENGNVQKMVYTDKTEEILLQKNYIERLHMSLSEKPQSLEKPLNFFSWFFSLLKKDFLIASTCLVSGMLVFCACHIVIGKFFSIFNVVDVSSFIHIILSILMAVTLVSPVIVQNICERLKFKHKQNALETEIYGLTNELEKAKEKLNNLEKEQKEINSELEDSNRIIHIHDDKENDNKINNIQVFWYSLGLNMNKYLKLDKKGLLKEELVKEYNDKSEIALDYIEEKVKTLKKV
jgi:hypothetical protein